MTIVLLLWGTRHGTAQQPATTAIVDVTIVPMDRERVLPHQTVIVQGDRILRLGPVHEVAVPRGAQRIEGQDKYLLPGLADMHAHPTITLDATGDTSVAGRVRTQRVLLLYLANGVTTLRVMGYAGAVGLAFRDQVARGEISGPRLYVGVGPADEVANATPETAAQYVAAARQAGYDFVKVHGGSGPMFDSLVAAARRVGLPVAGHPPQNRADGIPVAIQARMASVEHQMGLMTAADAQRYAVALKEAGVWVCPTLVQHDHGRARLKDPTWPERRYATAEFRPIATWSEPTAAERDAITEQQHALRILRDAGVQLLLGSDAPAGGVPGFEVLRELGALVEAGLTPYEALVTGTRNAAAYFGTLDSAGTIAAGKRADLVLLSGNPLTDVWHMAQPPGVMYGGHWLPRAELDRQLQPLEGFYAPQ